MNVGDVVELKSGGQPMVVTAVRKVAHHDGVPAEEFEEVSVAYVDANGHIEFDTVPAACVRPVSSAEKVPGTVFSRKPCNAHPPWVCKACGWTIEAKGQP